MVRQENWKLKSIENEEQHIELSGSSTSDEDIEKMDHSDFDSIPVEETLPIKEKNYSRGSKEIITKKLCVLLGRCNVSDRDAVRIIAAAAEALDANLQELSLSRTTVRARRQKFRERRANIIKNRFKKISRLF
ncbi:hypothetical protein JTE90_006636 [Oedothorax gibbosus]|uniref:Uncharacterized protein n=1 Tax=Oedothorax gibbosus TaxID=931172 RepID=A0AAV6U7R8_9ARAC|nr:hypothetical protein JTE90_006636 [Oedothorax gibbosus]